MDNRELLQIIRDARQLIDSKEKWVQNTYAADKNGKSLVLSVAKERGACRFCAAGAIGHVTGDIWEVESKYKEVFRFLSNISDKLYGNNLVATNDRLGYEAVIAVYDEGIKQLTK